MTEPKSFSDTTHLDIKFNALALIDVDQLAKSVTDQSMAQSDALQRQRFRREARRDAGQVHMA